MTDADAYFASSDDGVPTADGRFVDLNTTTPIELSPGLAFQPVLGEACMFNVVTFEPHTEAPMHTHVEEQLVFVLDGEIEFTVGDEARVLRPGEGIVIPPWVRHGAKTRDVACREMDIFSPPRANLVTLMNARGSR